jgi:hypothetical protein
MSAQDTTQGITQDASTSHQLPPIPPSSQRQSTSSSSSSTPKLALACLIPLPAQTAEEISAIEAPLTPMEEHEKNDGTFGSGPLEVIDGVAMMEESVGLHVADLVTQF